VADNSLFRELLKKHDAEIAKAYVRKALPEKPQGTFLAPDSTDGYQTDGTLWVPKDDGTGSHYAPTHKTQQVQIVAPAPGLYQPLYNPSQSLVNAFFKAWQQAFLGGYPTQKPKPLPALPVRKQVGGIVAYRGWNVAKHGDGRWVLESASVGTVWEGPVLTADKPPSDRESADTADEPANRGRGIYAYNAPRRNEVCHYGVWGEVLLYGRVVVHTAGYRAEKCMIRRLVVSPSAWMDHIGLEDDLVARYGCEVTTDFRTILQQKDKPEGDDGYNW
jgi:hypothetical protein